MLLISMSGNFWLVHFLSLPSLSCPRGVVDHVMEVIRCPTAAGWHVAGHA
jgi:hypothetical protein